MGYIYRIKKGQIFSMVLACPTHVCSITSNNQRAPNPLFLEPTNFLKPFQSMVHYFCSKRFVIYSWQMIATWTCFQCRFHQFSAAFTIIGHTKDVACNLHVAQKHKKLSKTSCVVCLFYLSCGSINWVWPHLNLIIGQILQFNRTHWFH